jgi:peptidyl-dipeptidase A
MPAPIDARAAAELATLRQQQLGRYAERVCVDGSCKDARELGLVLRDSRDPQEMLRWWTAWHDAAGPMATLYERQVMLANQGARDLGFADVGEIWRSWYDLPPDETVTEVQRLWQSVQPLYTKLHCHVRARLAMTYGDVALRDDGRIPAHLLGNLWAQDWRGLRPLLGLPAGTAVDVTRAIVERGLDAAGMVRVAEGFYVSLGFSPLPETFWQRSMLTRPDDREVICQPGVHDLGGGNDPRLSMCIRPVERDLIDLHHELGHAYYNLATRSLAPVYRDSPHDGFHEAVGDALTLSMTAGYRQRIGLEPPGPVEDEATRLARLLEVALDKLPSLAFAVTLDAWRWRVFAGELNRATWNDAYWAMRAQNQGIAPATARDPQHFDAGAKFHVASGHPYLRYFFALILQFQIHAALCDVAGQGAHLDECSIYGDAAAGARLRSFLALGATRRWPEALETLAGTRQMDATARLRYFAPLSRWLDEQNRGRRCGW